MILPASATSNTLFTYHYSEQTHFLVGYNTREERSELSSNDDKNLVGCMHDGLIRSKTVGWSIVYLTPITVRSSGGCQRHRQLKQGPKDSQSRMFFINSWVTVWCSRDYESSPTGWPPNLHEGPKITLQLSSPSDVNGLWESDMTWMHKSAFRLHRCSWPVQ